MIEVFGIYRFANKGQRLTKWNLDHQESIPSNGTTARQSTDQLWTIITSCLT